MKSALLRCCTTPIVLKQYETSTDAIFEKLGVGLVDVEGFNCCGYPLRNINYRAYLLCSARNLALAERENLNLVTICNCCYGSLKKADFLMKEDPGLKQDINRTLSREGLKYEGSIEVKHLLDILYHDVGIPAIKEKVVARFDSLKVATHYGCHILRPRRIARFDHPLAPSIFDRLVEVTGAESIAWPAKLECCGAPSLGIDDELSMDLTETKLKDAKAHGAQYLCVACPFCHIQFDRTQRRVLEQRGEESRVPCILYPQLLGLALGIDEEELGLEKNLVDLRDIRARLVENPEQAIA